MLNKRTCPLINFGKFVHPVYWISNDCLASPFIRACLFIRFSIFYVASDAKTRGGERRYTLGTLQIGECQNYWKKYFYPALLLGTFLPFQIYPNLSRKSPACPFSRHISTLPFYKIFKNCPPFTLIRACPLIKHLRALTGYPVYTKTQIEICKKFDIRFWEKRKKCEK